MLNTENKKQKVKKHLIAKVIGLLDKKTAKVSVTRSVFMSTPGKMIYVKKIILCHFDVLINIGDTVKISQCKPISKSKKFFVIH